MYADLLCSSVGASLLAMDVNDDAGCLNARVVLAFFASRLAPTGECVQLRPGRPPRFYPRMNTGTRPAEGRVDQDQERQAS